MKLQVYEPCVGKQKARRLGLHSERFAHQTMSRNALEALQYVKKKDRSDINLSEWKNNQFFEKNTITQLYNCPDQIIREDSCNLTLEAFHQKYEKQNLPVIIKGCTENWNMKTWTFQHFYDEHKQTKFKIGEDDDGYKLRVPLKYYLQYLVYNTDDSPLYLFESSLEDKEETKKIIENFNVPIYFRDDLFKIIGQKKRPPYRWLLMGPERSGSTVHIDPLGTSAWNTSLFGHKRWVLFKQNLPKSVVKGKKYRTSNYEDESINYFTKILPQIREDEDREAIQMKQFIQYPGETVFVPGGWWHAVINLDNTMAVTQNVMTHINFDKVWRNVRVQRRKLAFIFLEKLKQHSLQLYDRAIELNIGENYEMGEKYEKQSVSMSFSESQSSSSSSSDLNSSSNESKEQNKKKVKRKNKVMSKKSSSIRSQSYSRSRQKNKRTVHSYSEQKKFHNHETD